MVGWLFGWLIGWLVDINVGWLVDINVGWLVSGYKRWLVSGYKRPVNRTGPELRTLTDGAAWLPKIQTQENRNNRRKC